MKFKDRVKELRTKKIDTLQVNIIGKCNLRCSHCHIMKNPNDMTMTKDTMDDIIEFLKNHDFKTLDITGGEPTLHLDLAYLIENTHKLVEKIILRTNATNLLPIEKILKDYDNLNLVISLPCYTKENVDSMRGDGVYEKVIKNLKKLNDLGYGITKEMDLVYNPGGGFLPPDQQELQKDYKRELKDIKFNNLYTIANMPLGFFKDKLEKDGDYENYMNLLEENFNEENVEKLMCKFQISLDYNGDIYDCDFHQATNTKAVGNKNIKDIIDKKDLQREIVLKDYCYGCTAGSGSSCGGCLE
ncbi:MAG: arsenosugar biosynthesis radical SAM protein ArsS [Tissierellia bacterium]|nr:arsenosugar biosynthesis radical SAM protein ArsS [Tissierellia bacterium]